MKNLDELKNLKVGEEIKLPSPLTKGRISLEETILKRRSVRSFKNRPLTLEQISQLLWAAQGITSLQEGLRSAPSAGATYPLEVYLVSREGIFHYLPEKHALQKVIAENRMRLLAEACLGQDWIEETGVNIVLGAIFERTTGRYRQRGVGYVYIEVGHAAENIHLQAVALELGSVPVGAFDDDAVAKVLELPAKVKPLYVIPVGYP